MDILGWLAIAGAAVVLANILRKQWHRHAVLRRLRQVL